MTVSEIMSELQANGSESIKKLLVKHGIKEPFFGVKIEHLKKIQKRIKKDNELARGLFATGNADAMYLAGLIADDAAMSKEELEIWVKQAVSNNISEHTVPWVTAGNPHGYELAVNWIDSTEEYIAAAGWAALSDIVSLKDDNELDIAGLKSLLKRIEDSIASSPNRVRYTMNGFMIAVGTYVPELTDEAIHTANKIGMVTIDMNGTACKVPAAKDCIKKAADKGTIGVKKKTVKC